MTLLKLKSLTRMDYRTSQKRMPFREHRELVNCYSSPLRIIVSLSKTLLSTLFAMVQVEN